MTVVCQYISDKDRRGLGWRVSHTCSLAGMLDLAACLPALCHPAGLQELEIDNRRSLLQLWGSPGTEMQRQHIPDVHTSRPGHRCSTRALCVVEWHINPSLMAVSLQVLAGKHVSVLRTSQTLQPYFISADTHYRRGTHTLSYQQKKEK